MRFKFIDWVQRRLHKQEAPNTAPEFPRDLPEGLELLPDEIYCQIDLDDISTNQCRVSGRWIGSPKTRELRPIWDKKFHALHDEFDNILNEEYQYQKEWYNRFHGPGGKYETLKAKKETLMEMIIEAGDVDYQQHIADRKIEYKAERFEQFSFDVGGDVVVGYKPRLVDCTWERNTLTRVSRGKEMEDTQSSMTGSPANTQRKAGIFTDITDVCYWLQKHRKIEPFILPVDDSDAPDYSKIVKQPMSVGLLQMRQYNCNTEFIKNVRLIFDNCRLYNDADSWIVRDVEKIEAELLVMLKNSPNFAAAFEAYTTSTPDYQPEPNIQPATHPASDATQGECINSDATEKPSGSVNRSQPAVDVGQSSLEQRAVPASTAEGSSIRSEPYKAAISKRSAVDDSDVESERSALLSEVDPVEHEGIKRDAKRQKTDRSGDGHDSEIRNGAVHRDYTSAKPSVIKKRGRHEEPEEDGEAAGKSRTTKRLKTAADAHREPSQSPHSGINKKRGRHEDHEKGRKDAETSRATKRLKTATDARLDTSQWPEPDNDRKRPSNRALHEDEDHAKSGSEPSNDSELHNSRERTEDGKFDDDSESNRDNQSYEDSDDDYIELPLQNKGPKKASIARPAMTKAAVSRKQPKRVTSNLPASAGKPVGATIASTSTGKSRPASGTSSSNAAAAPSKQPKNESMPSSGPAHAAPREHPQQDAVPLPSAASVEDSDEDGVEAALSEVDIGFAQSENRDVKFYAAQPKGQRPWFFGHESENGYALYALKCPRRRCASFKQHPLRNNRAVDHFTRCGVEFTDENDIVRLYAKQVISAPPNKKNTHRVTIAWARSQNSSHPTISAEDKAADNFPED